MLRAIQHLSWISPLREESDLQHLGSNSRLKEESDLQHLGSVSFLKEELDLSPAKDVWTSDSTFYSMGLIIMLYDCACVCVCVHACVCVCVMGVLLLAAWLKPGVSRGLLFSRQTETGLSTQ